MGFEKGEIVFSGFGLSALKVSCPVTQSIQGYFGELVDQEPRVVSDVAHSMLQ